MLSYFEVKKLPVVVIDNFYNHNDYSRIWNDIKFLLFDASSLSGPSDTNSAYNIDEQGNTVFLKSNKGVFIDNLFTDRNMSGILTANRKVFEHTLQERLIDYHSFFDYLRLTNIDHTLLSYYENGDFYDYHHDESLITILSWFYYKPKCFKGGNLFLEDAVVECLDNRVVFFPSILNHKVENVELVDKESTSIPGRITISQFTGLSL